MAARLPTPWPTMYNKLLARGSEFYWMGPIPDRYCQLYRV